MNAASPEMRIAQAGADLDALAPPGAAAPEPAPPPPPPVAPPASTELQVAQAGADLDALTAPSYAGGTPDGSVASTPHQAAADLLNSGEREKGLERVEGGIKAGEQASVADKQAAAAAEKTQQAADFRQELAQSQQRYEEDHARTLAAYDKYKSSAGTLKDPEAQFYEDKGQGYRVQTALAAFAAGIGAGFNGQSGNPVLELLQKKIQANYDAHKQNVNDLYESGVAAGKIEDTSENHAKFLQDAKLRSYELQSAHVKDELASIAARAQSPLAKTAAAKTIEQIDQNQIGVRQKLAQQEAATRAAALATSRARTKEVREAFQKALEKHADLAPDEARVEATKDLHALGFNASETAPIFEANGVQTNPETGSPVFPETKPAGGPTEATVDDKGNIQVPLVSASGKRLKPEDVAHAQEEARKRVLIVDGKAVGLAPTADAAKTHNEGESNIKALDSFDPESIVKGSSLGGVASHLPGFLPGVETARKNVSAREAYNDQVRVSIGAAYKSGTGANEPKNLELIKTYAEPFEVNPTDSAALVQQKRENLKRFIRQNTGLAEPAKTPDKKAQVVAALGLVKG